MRTYHKLAVTDAIRNAHDTINMGISRFRSDPFSIVLYLSPFNRRISTTIQLRLIQSSALSAMPYIAPKRASDENEMRQHNQRTWV